MTMSIALDSPITNPAKRMFFEISTKISHVSLIRCPFIKPTTNIMMMKIADNYRHKYTDIPIEINAEKVSEVLIDKDELKDMLEILFNNAYQAMNRSDSEERKIEIKILPSNNKCTLQFQNIGSRIDEKVRERLFEIGASSNSDERGFGLYYIRDCITKFGGDIFYDEGFKDGVRFNLEFKQI